MPTPKVRVRFAPSPTGFLHIGSLRTALYNELFAKHHGGDFILRIEDTDRARYVEGSTESLCKSLEACGVIPNEGVWLDKKGQVIQTGGHGPYIQSERKDKHLKYSQELIKKDKAYYCFCTAKRLEELREAQQLAHQPTMYDGKCRAIPLAEAISRVEKGEEHVIRLKLPQKGKVTITDMIRGECEFDWALLDDAVIIKSDGFPTYHLAATCDDHDMEITHVIRGEEWLPSAPKHSFIYESLGWIAPAFAHLPLLLNPDRSKLSKRQGDVATEDYLRKGYLPEALLNFVALLGWNPTGDREIYSHEELADLFDISKVNKSGAIFNTEKLDWLNAQYIKNIPQEKYLNLTHPLVADKTDDASLADRALLLVRDRVIKPQDAVELTRNFFKDRLDYSTASLTWKKQSNEEAKERLEGVKEIISNATEADLQSVSKIEEAIKSLIAAKGWGNGDTLWPLRVALSGQDKSPGPFELVAMYGQKRSLARINDALKTLS